MKTHVNHRFTWVFFRLVVHKVIHIVKIPRLIKDRHGTYYLRVLVPKLAREILGKKEVRKSLQTKDPYTARQLAFAFNIWVEQLMTKPKVGDFNFGNIKKFDVEITPEKIVLKNINSAEDAERAKKFVADMGQVKSAVVAKPKSKLFNEAYRIYIDEKKADLGNAPSTIKSKETCYLEFQLVYDNPYVADITKESATAFKQRLIADGLAIATINLKVSHMSDFFTWAINHGEYSTANPFEKLKMAKSGSGDRSYAPFSRKELEKIYDHKAFMKHMGWKPDYYWLPIVCLYTGTRIEEVGGLSVDDFYLEDGIHYFKPRKAKNESSLRKVPVSSRLIELGFLEYVEEVRALKQEQLFFFLTVENRHGYSRNTSRRWGEYLDKLGITDKSKVFHSLRHTLINILTNKDTNTNLAMGLVGHIDQKKLPAGNEFSSTHAFIYDDSEFDARLASLKRVADSIDLDFLFSKYEPYKAGMYWRAMLEKKAKEPVTPTAPTKKKRRIKVKKTN